MKTYELSVEVLKASGIQFWKVEADSPEEAVERFFKGEATLVDEEFEAKEIGKPTIE